MVTREEDHQRDDDDRPYPLYSEENPKRPNQGGIIAVHDNHEGDDRRPEACLGYNLTAFNQAS